MGREIALDLQVLHRTRHMGNITATADPGDTGRLRTYLEDWLKAGKWHPSRWGEFTLIARRRGGAAALKRIGWRE